MAMPYMENEAAIDSLQAAEWLKGLVTTVQNSGLPSEKIVFELQTVNGRSERPLPAGEITNWLHILRQAGVQNIGYYPDNVHTNQPPIQQMKPVLDQFQ